MINIDELIKGVPSHYQNAVYERMASMTEAEQESLAKEIEAAIATSPEAQGLAEERARQREAREATAPKVGETAPDFDLGTVEGDARIRLSALKGKPVGLIFGSYT